MQRVLVYDREDSPLFELSPNEVYRLDRHEVVNGEHSLTIRTTRTLEQGQRVLTRDNRGYWREHVVYGIDERHDGGSSPIREYYCVWSLQHDLTGYNISAMVGTQTPVAARVALTVVLSGTSRWEVGTVTNSNVGGASMYDMSGWNALGVLIGTWGGEVSTTITVSNKGVIGRAVDLYSAQGSQVPLRRFDFGADLKSVRRKVEDGPLYCRISPRGKGEDTGSGYGRKITIESVNGGKDWLENGSMRDLARLPDGNGGWEYPTLIVENGEIDTPSDLKAWGLEVLEDYTTPKVTYELDAIQAAVEGVDVQGLSLGDAVDVVDAKFDGLRLRARAMAIETDMLRESSVRVTLGSAMENIASSIAGMHGSISSLVKAVGAMQSGVGMTDEYMQHLLARLNEEINATGGYAYITEGQGIRCYDAEVSDPLVGAEATKVVEIKGGTIRIADTKTAQGEWEWKTVFVSGHVAAALVTAANIVTGYIGSATSGNYWDLDTGEFRLAATALLGTSTVSSVLTAVNNATSTLATLDTQQGVFNRLTNNGALQGLYMYNGQLYVNASYINTGQLLADLITTGKITSTNGKVYFDLDNNELVCDKMVSTDSNNTVESSIGYITVSGSRYYGNLITKGSDAINGILLVPSDSNGIPEIRTPSKHMLINALTQQGGGSRDKGLAGMMITEDGYTVIFGQQYQSYSISEQTAISSTSNSHLGRIVLHPAYSGSGTTYSADGQIEMFGDVYCHYECAAGSFRTLSDKRLKEHVASVGDEAADFVRKLKPSLFEIEGIDGEHLGFYAQDVEEADPWGALVTENADGTKMLDYNGLIAPLVAYCQQLERRIEALERASK